MKRNLLLSILATAVIILFAGPGNANASIRIATTTATFSQSNFADCCGGKDFSWAFDNNTATYWRLLGAVSGDWGQVDYTEGHYITSYKQVFNSGYQPDGYTLQGSNDAGATWTDIDVRNSVYSTIDNNEYMISSPACYLSYRWTLFDAHTSAHIFPEEIYLYEDDTHVCETPPPPESTTTPLAIGVDSDAITTPIFSLVVYFVVLIFTTLWPFVLVAVVVAGFAYSLHRFINRIINKNE